MQVHLDRKAFFQMTESPPSQPTDRLNTLSLWWLYFPHGEPRLLQDGLMRDGLVLTLFTSENNILHHAKKCEDNQKNWAWSLWDLCFIALLIVFLTYMRLACYIFYLLLLFGNGKTAKQFCVDSKPFLGCSGLPDLTVKYV